MAFVGGTPISGSGAGTRTNVILPDRPDVAPVVDLAAEEVEQMGEPTGNNFRRALCPQNRQELFEPQSVAPAVLTAGSGSWLVV